MTADNGGIDTPNRPVRLALFGAGRIGAVHAHNVSAMPGVELRHVVDPTPAGAALAHTLATRHSDAKMALNDDALDGVLICSSTDSHAELIIAAAERGLAVFCEKPVSLDFRTVVRVTEAVEQFGIRCMLGFQRRYDPDFRTVRQRIQSGRSGQLEQLIMHTRDPAPPSIDYVRRSGGMLQDQAIHDFDQARYMCGEEIVRVFAVGNCQIEPAIGAAGDIDTLMVVMTTASGCMIQMANSRRGPLGYDQRLEAHCSHEVLFIDNGADSNVRIASAEGALTAPPKDYFITRFASAYSAEMEAFLTWLRGGPAPLATIRDGLEAQRLAEASLQSIISGLPVELTPGWQLQGE
ncbi:Gfo/Idh/MocA family oxidoreductase [uncultured Devosia sp.]|uniref:Gfo/Idh/MocA family protein n=1 Tax=uncultured Devosia sp. TaxID=211434 RepID=UPI00261488AB|nr:Gfo/Idh/MocA family oxidoreductase [uncultured Devosia sp.]